MEHFPGCLTIKIMNEIKYAVVRLLISKDDVYDIHPIAYYNGLPDAEAELNKYTSSGTWQDYKEFEIHVYRNGKDMGSINLLKEMYKIKNPGEATDCKSCMICSRLADTESGFQKYGSSYNDTFLPDASDKLTLVADFKQGSGRKSQLKQCPDCKTFYLYETDYEYLAFGSEDEQKLTRLNILEAALYLNKL
jgi:hypothetical protein